MWIIVEGADGTGKTTFVDRLVEVIDDNEAKSKKPRKVEVVHHSKPQAHPLIEYERDYERYSPDGPHIISDRLHWGELLYGPLYRGESNLSASAWLHIDKFIQSRGGVMIHLDHKKDVILQRWADRGEDFLQEEHLDFVLEGYHRIVDTSSLDTHTFIDPDHTAVLATALLGYHQESVARELRPFSTYIGPRYPQYLLFGEKRADPSYGSAFVPYPTTSGQYLFNALPSAIQKNFGVANALEENCKELWELLGNPRVVALGKLASKELKRAEVPHEAVPHPQFVRRFHNKRGAEYGMAISRALHGEPVEFP